MDRAVADRVRHRYPTGEVAARRNEVAYRRLVARLFARSPDGWVLRGGYAMILRLDPNRTSNDVDVAYVHAAGEHAVALRELERAMQLDLGDFFSFEVVRAGEATPERARRITVRCRLGAREFATFRVDLAAPEEDVPMERLAELPPLTGIEQVDETPPVLVIAWVQQIAEKTCAMFESHEGAHSSRARDLADISLIAQQVDGVDGDELIAAIRSEQERRRTRSLPDGLPVRLVLTPEQEAEWRSVFPGAIRNAEIEFDKALEIARRFLDPALDRSAADGVWDAPRFEWRRRHKSTRRSPEFGVTSN
jgi:hypothetical protein